MTNLYTVKGRVIWITGLSGAGKTTLGDLLYARFRQEDIAAIRLDGDQLREVFDAAAPDADHHRRAARLALAMSYSRLCGVLARQGLVVIISTISMFDEIYRLNRETLPGYSEIFIDVPLEELRRRDPKRLYRDFDAGRIDNIAGLDLEVDRPAHPDFVVDPGQSAEASAAGIFAALMADAGPVR